MDDATHHEFRSFQRCIGEHTAGLGALFLDYPTPEAALKAPEGRLAELPPATQRALHRARVRWPEARRRSCLPESGTADCPAGSGEATGFDAGAASVFLPIRDERFPPSLREAPDPPPWLFCRGHVDALHRPAVAIVGSRRASRSGLRTAHALARALAGTGYVVCSGLALGIDAAAHRGALAAATAIDGDRGHRLSPGGDEPQEAALTLAVLASGVDCPSPATNVPLARQIEKRGCLVSELPAGTRPNRTRFPRRNRIVSGLSRATIIVEAALPSGSLHTAAAALEQGRDVYVLPWSIHHGQGAGCLRLLRDGATPITSLGDLADFFPPLTQAQRPAGDGDAEPAKKACAVSSPLAKRLLDAIGDDALSADVLRAAMGVPSTEVMAALTDLELSGQLVRIDGLYQRRI